MEQLQYNLLFRWFVGLGVDDPVWVPTVFTKNRDRLMTTDISRKVMAAILAHREIAPLLSDEHFSVDGTLIKAWESDSKLCAGFHGFASMRVTRLMWAMRSQASALAMVFSQSFAIRRHLPSHAKVRSTTHLRGMASKPCAVSERLTIWSVQRPIFSNEPVSLGPA
jgi:hypothetical protein